MAVGKDLRKVTDLVRGSKEFRLGSGVFWDAFSAISLTPAVIRKLVGEGSVWVTGQAVVVTRLGGEGREVWRQVCFLTGEPEQAMKLVRRVFTLKANTKPTRKLVYLPQGSRLIGTLRQEGFKRLASLILFERRAANG